MTLDPRWRTLQECIDDEDLMQGPEEVVAGLAWRNRVTLFAAREKTGKSTYAAFCAASLSNVNENPVLWIGLEEDLSDVAMRFNKFEAVPSRVIISEFLPNRIKNLRDAIEDHRPDLVVIDSLPVWAIDKVNDSNVDSQVTPMMMDLVNTIRGSGAAAVLIHHLKKSSDVYRGSTAFGASVDMMVTMTPNKADPFVRDFNPKGRWAVKPYSRLWTGIGFEPSSGKTNLQELVFRYIRGNPECGLTHIRDGVRRDGVRGRNSTIDKTVHQLEKDGRIINLGEKSRSLYVTSKSATNDMVADLEGRFTGRSSDLV